MEAYGDYIDREAEEERREQTRELEARFLEEEFHTWEYFTPKGGDDAGTDLR